MDRDTWNALEESDEKAWDGLSEPAKTKITTYHFNKGKEYASQSSKVNQMEAKEHETIQVSNAESTRNMYEDEGVDFDMILQAQQASTRLQTYKHELLDSDSADEESVADLEVNVHDFTPKVEGLMQFSNSDSEDEFALHYPGTMEEALAHDARGEIDDPDEEIEELIEKKVTTRIPGARLPKGLLHFDNSDEDKETFQLRAYGFTSSKEEAIPDQHNDRIEGEGGESIIGEQEGNTSGLTESDTDQRRLVDEFYAQDGLWKFLNSEDKAEDKGKVATKEQEAKVMTRSEYEKAGIKPPPVNEAAYPANRKPRSVSPKPTSPKITKTTSPKQQTKATSPKQSPKIKVLVATDTICTKQDPQHQPGSIVVVHNVASPKQTSTKSLVAPTSTPNTHILAQPQQISPKVQTPTKTSQAKTDMKKASPVKGEQQSMKGPKPYKGKGPSKPTEKKPLTMNQKIAEVDKKIEAKAKQADRSNSPTMQKPFDKVSKPIKTVNRIVESPDGKGYQLLPEEEKKKLDTAQKFQQLGLLAFSDDEDDELSLETITSNKSKGSNKSQSSQKSTTKPEVE